MVNAKGLKGTKAKLKAGEELTLEMVGDVFGQEFWILIVEVLLDSQDAARAIQLAVAKVRAGANS